jgi:hypothetical protein
MVVSLDLFNNLIGSRTSLAFFRPRAFAPPCKNAISQGSCLETEVSKQLYSVILDLFDHAPIDRQYFNRVFTMDRAGNIVEEEHTQGGGL